MHRYAEDSFGRLWGTGHYGGLGYFENGNFVAVGTGGDWWSPVQPDPDRPGTIWANQGWNILRTDAGTYGFSRETGDFPELSLLHFSGLAADRNGVAWVGAATATGSALLRVDANTGSYQSWQTGPSWPFPGDFVYPQAVTPDGRVWMVYESNYPSTVAGLLWWDGVQVGTFPAPPNGQWQWGGLPGGIILDLNVKVIPSGYELWMSCASRGIAVLTVQGSTTAVLPGEAPAVRLTLAQNAPNPFTGSTRLRFDLPAAGSAKLDIYDVSGRLVRRLVDGALAAGSHEITWDGRASGAEPLPSGVYLYRLEAGGEVAERRLLLLR